MRRLFHSQRIDVVRECLVSSNAYRDLAPKHNSVLTSPGKRHFTHDPDIYSDPEEFKPERFLIANGHKPEPEPEKFVFGFGRRICPGKLLADQILYLAAAQSLAVFDVNKASVDGVEVECKPEFQAGVVSHPSPFKNTIKPRSSHHEELIESLKHTYRWKPSDGPALEGILR